MIEDDYCMPIYWVVENSWVISQLRGQDLPNMCRYHIMIIIIIITFIIVLRMLNIIKKKIQTI